MSGFPLRPSRVAFGPTYVNKRPIRRTDQEVGKDVVNLSCWQLAGSGLVVPLAWASVAADGSLISAGEAWDPIGVYLPVTAKVATGSYTVTYLASYPDENGAAQSIGFTSAKVSPSGTTPIVAVWKITTLRIIEVRTFVSNTGAAVDAPFSVEAR